MVRDAVRLYFVHVPENKYFLKILFFLYINIFKCLVVFKKIFLSVWLLCCKCFRKQKSKQKKSEKQRSVREGLKWEREREIGGGQWGFEKWACGMGSSEWWVWRMGSTEWVWGMCFLGFWVSWMEGTTHRCFGHCSTNELGLGWVGDEIGFGWIALGWWRSRWRRWWASSGDNGCDLVGASGGSVLLSLSLSLCASEARSGNGLKWKYERKLFYGCFGLFYD